MRIKYLGENQRVNDLSSENSRGKLKKWKAILCFWIRSINTVKKAILPKTILRYNALPIKTPTFFKELIIKFIWNHNKIQIAKVILKRRTKLKKAHSLTSDYTINLQ